LVEEPHYRGWIFDELGLGLMSLGRVAQAIPFFERERAVAESLGDARARSFAYQNLAEAQAYAGDLAASSASAELGISCAIESREKWARCYSLCRRAWSEYLLGHVDEARRLYESADQLQIELDGLHLYSQRGVQFALFLITVGQEQRARELTDANLEHSQ